YIRDTAEALDFMNEQHHLQHLDIKPRNLFLISDRVKVADFGLVKHLERGKETLSGGFTPLYAAPETFVGSISSASDQYSLAIVYQEMLTGLRPFNGKNARQLAFQHQNEDPDLRALPEQERPILARALSKKPEGRFPNCMALVKALYNARAPVYASMDPKAASRAGDTGGKSVMDTLENVQLEEAVESEVEIPVEVEGLSLAKLTEDNEAVSQLGVTVASPSSGVLRPTLVVGVGGIGRLALMELRSRLLDRFGDLEKAPLFRFLYLDTDPDAVRNAQRGAAEIALRSSEVFHLPLQSSSSYRKRQVQHQLESWLPLERMYNIPRSLKTQGSRCLGRLAFTDNYLRLIARLKRELYQACDADLIFKTVSQTGLALRDTLPRIYLIAGASGGSSGFINDLGFSLRRLLNQMNQPDSGLTTFLFTGSPDDPTTTRLEQANLYATLTEVSHYADPSIRFSAQYGTDGPRLADDSKPFDGIYLIPQRNRSPESRRDALSHLGSYLFYELTTPLGLRVEKVRQRATGTLPFRSFGTFGVWFPRGLLLRMAAQDACLRLINDWQAPGQNLSVSEQTILDAEVNRILTDPTYQPENISGQIEELAATSLGMTPRESLTRMLQTLEDQLTQPVSQDDPGAWAKQTLQRVRDWLGSGVAIPGVNQLQQRRTAITRSLETGAKALSTKKIQEIEKVVGELMGYSGRRLAIAESALSRILKYCENILTTHQAKWTQTRTSSELKQLELDIANCSSGAGGWSLFGNRTRRNLRVFVDHLTTYSRRCLADDTSAAVLQFFAALRGRLSDYIKDVNLSRQRLRNLQDHFVQGSPVSDQEIENVAETMSFSRTSSGPASQSHSWGPPSSVSQSHSTLLSAETYWKTISKSTTNRVVLPNGEKDLATAAKSFLSILNPDHWNQLDQSIGDAVLGPRGGLVKICMETSDLGRFFAAPMLSQAISLLSSLLPITDVAEAEFTSAEKPDSRIQQYYQSAVPLMISAGSAVGSKTGDKTNSADQKRGKGVGPVPDDQAAFILIPASDPGKSFGELAKEKLPDLFVVNVPGQADLMFCREQIKLPFETLKAMLKPARAAYMEIWCDPMKSPHSRFDVTDWTPLDP
ncbi:MAG: tubulin-like doman-containing protein, partial [Gemmataceae bacterium]